MGGPTTGTRRYNWYRLTQARTLTAARRNHYDYYPSGGSELELDKSDAYALVNVSGGVGPSSGAYEVGFYVDNLTDHKYYQIIGTDSFGTDGQVELNHK
jgi:outer membrane receptor protein involved in Fe transport